MSIKRMTDVWENSPASGSALLIHLALADFANDKGVCWPSFDTLAKKARVTRRGAIKIINQLVKENLIQKSIRMDGEGNNTSNLYTVLPLGSEQSSLGVVNPGSLGVVNPGSPKPSVEPSVNPWALKVFDLWPRRDSKHAAIKLIETFLRNRKGTDEENARWLGVRVKRQLAIWAAEGRPTDKIPHLRTWMYQKVYEDDVLQDRAVSIPKKESGSIANILTEAERRRLANGKK